MRAKLEALDALVRIPFRISWWRPLAAAGMQALSQLAAVSFAFGMREAIDGVSSHRSGPAMVGVAVLSISALWATGGSYVAFVLRNQMVERTTLALDTDLGEGASSIVGVEHFERHEYLEKLELLRQQHQSLAQLPDWLTQLLGAVVRLVVTIAVLASIDPRLLILPVFSIPSILGSFRLQKIAYGAMERISLTWRLQAALFRLGAEEPGGRELRVFGRSEFLAQRFSTAVEQANSILTSALRRGTAVQTGGWGVFGLAFAGALLLVGHDALSHHVGIGDVVLAITLAAQMNTQVVQVGSVLGGVGQGLQTAERYVWLREQARSDLARRPRPDVVVPVRLRDGIRFHGVSFSYPGTDRAVLKEVDLFVPAGSAVALVGANGAGKTTLAKLLTRMYEPSAGQITVDGVDLASLPAPEWRKRISAGFQDYARFEFVARESVGVGDLARVHDDPTVLRALSTASADEVLSSLPDGLDTPLGRQFEEGVELSGGQWQKLALGRAMMRTRPLLLVLDEPTASLDGAAEAALFDQYAVASREAARARGTITLFVTHRLSTIQIADLIVVIDQGRIVEAGSHDDLMNRDGSYAELFQLQAASYE